MAKTFTEIAAEIRKEFDTIKEELEANGICIRRECMCDTAAPVVKLEAAIVEMEQKAPLADQLGSPSESAQMKRMGL